MRFVVAFMLAMLACATARGQTLWRDIPAGATVEQVHKLLPGATDITNPQALGGSLSDWLGLVEYKDFQLAGVDFEATFYFKAGKLMRVRLAPRQDPEGDEAYGVAGRLRDSLMTKYGKPLDETSNNSGLSSGYELSWASNGAQVHFSYFQAGKMATIVVYYEASQDSANL